MYWKLWDQTGSGQERPAYLFVQRYLNVEKSVLAVGIKECFRQEKKRQNRMGDGCERQEVDGWKDQSWMEVGGTSVRTT